MTLYKKFEICIVTPTNVVGHSVRVGVGVVVDLSPVMTTLCHWQGVGMSWRIRWVCRGVSVPEGRR